MKHQTKTKLHQVAMLIALVIFIVSLITQYSKWLMFLSLILLFCHFAYIITKWSETPKTETK